MGKPISDAWVQALYRCDTLYDVVPIGHGRHYKVSDQYSSGVVCQDSCRHFSINAENCTPDEMKTIFANVLGAPIPFEMIASAPWRHNLLCAQRYVDGRVMLAGDSAHLVIPTAGLGLNTGIGDAIDLSWKLSAILWGWGSPQLIQAYEDERRQIGVRNVRASGNATAERRERREDHWVPWIREDSDRGREFANALGRSPCSKRTRPRLSLASSAATATPTRPYYARNPGRVPTPTLSSTCRRHGRVRDFRTCGAKTGVLCSTSSGPGLPCFVLETLSIRPESNGLLAPRTFPTRRSCSTPMSRAHEVYGGIRRVSHPSGLARRLARYHNAA